MKGYFQAPSAPSRLTLSTCTVDIDTTPNSVIVTVTGEVDTADADRVGEVLAGVAAKGRPIVRVDLGGLTFADSSAVKAIIIGARAAEARGFAYELVNPHGSIRRLLGVTGLADALTIVDEPEFQTGLDPL